MIKIYCLYNPLTFEPFYVGATSYSLNYRLRSHLSEARRCKELKPNSSIITRRQQLIKKLIAQDLTPKIAVLFVINKNNTDLMETFCHDLLNSFGFQLIQNQDRFTYQGHYCKDN